MSTEGKKIIDAGNHSQWMDSERVTLAEFFNAAILSAGGQGRGVLSEGRFMFMAKSGQRYAVTLACRLTPCAASVPAKSH